MRINRDNNDESILVEVGFMYPRKKFDDMFREKLEGQGLNGRDLTDDECDDLKLEMQDYFTDQIYSLFWEYLEINLSCLRLLLCFASQSTLHTSSTSYVYITVI
jgi:hypothetical protein